MLEVLARRSQQDNIICKKQRWNPVAPKPEPLRPLAAPRNSVHKNIIMIKIINHMVTSVTLVTSLCYQVKIPWLVTHCTGRVSWMKVHCLSIFQSLYDFASFFWSCSDWCRCWRCHLAKPKLIRVVRSCFLSQSLLLFVWWGQAPSNTMNFTLLKTYLLLLSWIMFSVQYS